jgi:hypothetical protein
VEQGVPEAAGDALTLPARAGARSLAG